MLDEAFDNFETCKPLHGNSYWFAAAADVCLLLLNLPPFTRAGSYKTLVKWANSQCKARIAFRAKEKRTSGLATVQAPAPIDSLAGKLPWCLNPKTLTLIKPRYVA